MANQDGKRRVGAESETAGCTQGLGASVRLPQTVEVTISLEPSIWEAFQEIAAEQGKAVNELTAEIERTRPQAPAPHRRQRLWLGRDAEMAGL